MDPREPAGWERGEGKSAELSAWAQAASGAGGNTRGTVCGTGRRGAIRLQNLRALARERAVGRGVSLPTFLIPAQRNKGLEDTNHEV